MGVLVLGEDLIDMDGRFLGEGPGEDLLEGFVPGHDREYFSPGRKKQPDVVDKVGHMDAEMGAVAVPSRRYPPSACW